jgi:hypothetical protein
MQRPITPTVAQIHRGDGTIIRELRLLDLPGDAMGKTLAEFGNRKMPQSIGRPVINIDHHNQKIRAALKALARWT